MANIARQSRFLVQSIRSNLPPQEKIRQLLERVRETVSAAGAFCFNTRTGHTLRCLADGVPENSVCLPEHEELQALSEPAYEEYIVQWQQSEQVSLAIPLNRSGNLWIGLFRNEPNPFSEVEVDLLLLARELIRQDHAKEVATRNIRSSLESFLKSFSATIDARDPYTAGHSARVARVAVRIGRQLNLTPNEVSELYIGGLLHDVGKLGIRDAVLLKPGRLTAEEFAHIKEHPIIGEKIVTQIPALKKYTSVVRLHHERMDGSGYPDGLKGEEIPLAARVMGVADTCDALLSSRSYRPARSPDNLEGILNECAGLTLDRRVVEAFFETKTDILTEIYPNTLREKPGGTESHAIDTLLGELREAEGGTGMLLTPLPED